MPICYICYQLPTMICGLKRSHVHKKSFRCLWFRGFGYPVAVADDLFPAPPGSSRACTRKADAGCTLLIPRRSSFLMDPGTILKLLLRLAALTCWQDALCSPTSHSWSECPSPAGYTHRERERARDRERERARDRERQRERERDRDRDRDRERERGITG